MIKFYLLFLLIIAILSCNTRGESSISEDEFENKTFDLISTSNEGKFVIEFQDSTYQIFGNFYEGKTLWRISDYDNTSFLILGDKVIGVKKKNDNLKFECISIGLVDYKFELIERKSKWKKELIYGIWVKKENSKSYDFSKSDTTPRPPSPDFRPADFTEKDRVWPAFYEIRKDSIFFNFAYSKNKSGLQINFTNEYLIMNLEVGYGGGRNSQWRIIGISDFEMIVEREVTNYGKTQTKIDTLVRKGDSN